MRMLDVSGTGGTAWLQPVNGVCEFTVLDGLPDRESRGYRRRCRALRLDRAAASCGGTTATCSLATTPVDFGEVFAVRVRNVK